MIQNQAIPCKNYLMGEGVEAFDTFFTKADMEFVVMVMQNGWNFNLI